MVCNFCVTITDHISRQLCGGQIDVQIYIINMEIFSPGYTYCEIRYSVERYKLFVLLAVSVVVYFVKKSLYMFIYLASVVFE